MSTLATELETVALDLEALRSDVRSKGAKLRSALPRIPPSYLPLAVDVLRTEDELMDADTLDLLSLNVDLVEEEGRPKVREFKRVWQSWATGHLEVIDRLMETAEAGPGARPTRLDPA